MQVNFKKGEKLMKFYKKIAMLLILVLTLTAGLMACGNADTTNETEETIAEETAVEDTENTEETEEETVAATVVESTAPVVIPDGFTERDFEIGYSDYEKMLPFYLNAFLLLYQADKTCH